MSYLFRVTVETSNFTRNDLIIIRADSEEAARKRANLCAFDWWGEGDYRDADRVWVCESDAEYAETQDMPAFIGAIPPDEEAVLTKYKAARVLGEWPEFGDEKIASILQETIVNGYTIPNGENLARLFGEEFAFKFKLQGE